jgi:mono/diheme cytochrome c family protein
VMFGSSLSVSLRRRFVAVLPLALCLLAGCDPIATGSYPADLTYPARTDPIVKVAPGVPRPFYPDQPGTLDQMVLKIGVPEDKGGLGGKALDPKKAAADKRQELNSELKKLFGSPAAPIINLLSEDVQPLVSKLKLEAADLAAGSQLYRRHCMTCHGVPGDGRGPTGPWVHPHPRDYRQGLFKFISTDPAKFVGRDTDRKPRRADLLRTLNAGVDGTTMPSFGLLPAAQLEQLVSYVIHLSLRGEVESETLTLLVQQDDLFAENGEQSSDATVVTTAHYFATKTLQAWAASDDAPLRPAPYPYDPENEVQRQASVARGYELFTSSTPGEHPGPIAEGAGCIKCHYDFGRQVNFQYDMWGTLVRPANLTVGVYRGGRRPIDLYWRIRGGIIPSQMPAPADMRALNRQVLDKEMKPDAPFDPYWDLVNFVQALPYPEMLPKNIRDKVYPSPDAPVEEQHAAR